MFMLMIIQSKVLYKGSPSPSNSVSSVLPNNVPLLCI